MYIYKLHILGDTTAAQIGLDYNRLTNTASTAVLPFVCWDYTSLGCGPNTTYTLSMFAYNKTTRMVTTDPLDFITSNDTTFEILFPSGEELLYLFDTNDGNYFIYYRLLFQAVNTSFHAPGDEVCVSIPSTPYCPFPLLVWSENGEYCICNPSLIEYCPCSILPTFDGDRVCFQDSTIMNNTVITFECSAQLCSHLKPCTVVTLVYAEKVMNAGKTCQVRSCLTRTNPFPTDLSFTTSSSSSSPLWPHLPLTFLVYLCCRCYN